MMRLQISLWKNKGCGLLKQSTRRRWRRSMTSASCREELRITAPTTQCDKFQEGRLSPLSPQPSSSSRLAAGMKQPPCLSRLGSVDSTFSTVGPDMYGVHGKNPAS
ncbi:unnamed protein product [Lasius platythorax]|uniref:Uncharacterized protein n=1 Tax=Lasius platythorax TaxID=488582 RepID=A0AAV2P1Z2_9HYME